MTGIEGRAGMAAIVDTANTIDLKQFSRNLQLRLPTYARPIFLRLLDKLDLTGQLWSFGRVMMSALQFACCPSVFWELCS